MYCIPRQNSCSHWGPLLSLSLSLFTWMLIIREEWVNSCITIILGGYASRAAIHLKATQKRRFLIDDLGLTSQQGICIVYLGKIVAAIGDLFLSLSLFMRMSIMWQRRMGQLWHHYYTWRIHEQGSNTYTMLFYEPTFIVVPMFQEIKGPIIYITFGRSLSSWYPKKLYSIAHAKKVCLVSQINCDSILNFFTSFQNQ